MIGFVDRWALAVVAPRQAMAAAEGAAIGGRPGVDVAWAVVATIAVAHTRGLVAAGWIAAELGPRAAVAPLLRVVTTAATVPLVLVAIAAAVVWLAAGRRRDLGRDADLACVAVLPPSLVAIAVASIARWVAVPPPLPLVIVVAALVWPVVVAVRIARERRP